MHHAQNADRKLQDATPIIEHEKMTMTFRNLIHKLAACLLMGSVLTSCSMMEEDLPPCPQGLDLYFRYDYNLQRANMFPDHVGAVDVYVYEGKNQQADGSYANWTFVKKFSEAVTPGTTSPFKADGYHMHLDLAPGTYKYIVLAHQKRYEETLLTTGAKQRRTEPAIGDDIKRMAVTLDHNATADAHGRFAVDNGGAPLDTLWHGLRGRDIAGGDSVVVKVNCKPVAQRDTVGLVRDTKHINIALRELQTPENVDVNNFDFRILDSNARILWDNTVDETTPLVYTPYRTWNTSDRTPAPSMATKATTAVGRIAHADFMTSRLIYHADMSRDAILSVTNRTTGEEVIRVDLADFLSRLRTSADYRYSAQEFLDRGYDYKLTFFLQGGSWKYVSIEISVLGWSRRIQREDL